MNVLFRLSLRMKFFLLFTLPIGGIAVFLYWYFPEVWKAHALQSITKKAELMTRMAALDLRSGLLFSDYPTIREHVAELGKLDDVVYVVVETEPGLSIVSYNDSVAGNYRDALNNTLSSDSKLFRTAAPVVHEGVVLGKLYLGLSLANLQEEIIDARTAMAWISGLVFLFGAALVLITSTIATNSLQRLSRTIDKIADGNYAERASVSTGDEIGQLAAGFNHMAEKVQMTIERERELHNLKTQFIRTVSHEFRTPLTSISLITDMLITYYERMSKEEKIEYLVRIRQSVTDLNELINEFLLQSSASSMRDLFTPAQVDIESVVRTIATSMATLAAAHSISIQLHIDSNIPPLLADIRFLQHIVRNLLSNAVKYSRPHSAVQCSVLYDGHAVSLRIVDSGIGIPESELGQLFTPFFRASNTGNTQGTGLGLSIVKEFVEIHGGTISVESAEGKGSTFLVVLPAVLADTATTAQ